MGVLRGTPKGSFHHFGESPDLVGAVNASLSDFVFQETEGEAVTRAKRPTIGDRVQVRDTQIMKLGFYSGGRGIRLQMQEPSQSQPPTSPMVALCSLPEFQHTKGTKQIRAVLGTTAEPSGGRAIEARA